MLPSPWRYGEKASKNKWRVQTHERNKSIKDILSNLGMNRSFDLRVLTNRRNQSREISLQESSSRNLSMNLSNKKSDAKYSFN